MVSRPCCALYAVKLQLHFSDIVLVSLTVTLIASSGDDGVAGNRANQSPDKCGYFPQFPASSPYVTAVGGTQGPESYLPEVAAQGNTPDGLITSGGGFSTKSPVPIWQSGAVAGYHTLVKDTAIAPFAGFATGRGYPDVSLAANNYVIVESGHYSAVSGTSASAPVFAAMVSLVNAGRLAAGKSALGWINPALYTYAHQFANDVTVGENNCAGKNEYAVLCCSQGFHASKGWDPVTGLGSINFDKFNQTLHIIAPPPLPTMSPSVKDATPVPSVVPTAMPTASAGFIYMSSFDTQTCGGKPHSVSGLTTNHCFRGFIPFGYNVSAGVFLKFFCDAGLCSTFETMIDVNVWLIFEIFHVEVATMNVYSGSSCDEDSIIFGQGFTKGCVDMELTASSSVKRSMSFSCSAAASPKDLPFPATTGYLASL